MTIYDRRGQYNRKAQHEIAGFVIIVVVVAVIGLVVLGLMIGRGEVSKVTSVEVENLLLAVMQKTSDCAGTVGYYNTEELLVACYNNRQCKDGMASCEVLGLELEDVVGRSLNIGSGGVNKGFEISVEYSDLNIEGDVGTEIVPIIMGGSMDECSTKIGASKSIDVGFGSGVIDVGLEVCRG